MSRTCAAGQQRRRAGLSVHLEHLACSDGTCSSAGSAMRECGLQVRGCVVTAVCAGKSGMKRILRGGTTPMSRPCQLWCSLGCPDGLGWCRRRRAEARLRRCPAASSAPLCSPGLAWPAPEHDSWTHRSGFAASVWLLSVRTHASRRRRGVERRHALAVRAQLRAAMLRRPEPASAGRSHQRAMKTALAEVWARSARLGHLHRRPDGACLDGRASFPAKRIHASNALERQEARAACSLLSRTRS